MFGRWSRRRDGARRPRLIGCLMWLIALIILLIILALLFGGFRKGTKAAGPGTRSAPAVAVAVTMSHLGA